MISYLNKAVKEFIDIEQGNKFSNRSILFTHGITNKRFIFFNILIYFIKK